MSDVAVIGLGSIGTRHVKNLIKLGHAVHGYDPEPARREALADSVMIAYEDAEKALTKVTAAIVSSPSRLHAEHVTMALEMNCHVLVEKPLAPALAGLRTLIDRAGRMNRIFAVAQNLRFLPTIMKAREIILNGDLGDILWGRFHCSSYLPDWRPDQDYRTNYTADPKSGGVIFDIIHEFDLAHYILGPFKTLAARCRHTGRLEIAAEDTAEVILQHASGPHSTLHLDYASRPARRYIAIAGTTGLLEIDILKKSLKLTGENGIVAVEESYDSDNAQTYVDELCDFFSAIEKKTDVRCSGADAFEVLEQVIAVRQLCGLPHL